MKMKIKEEVEPLSTKDVHEKKPFKQKAFTENTTEGERTALFLGIGIGLTIGIILMYIILVLK